jgi:hypothetical protein
VSRGAMRRHPRGAGRAATLVLVGAGLLAAATPARAITKIEGEYQLMLDTRNNISQRGFAWDWDSNNNDNGANAQLRLFSQPRPNVDAFIKFEADFNTPGNDTPRPVFQYREAHAAYHWTPPNRAVHAYLFSRQDRYWVDNYLLKIVENPNNSVFTDNGQGVRLETSGFLGLHSVFYAMDFSGQFNPAATGGTPPPDAVFKTDDAYVGRLRREFFADKRLRLGVTYNRKVETSFATGSDSRLGHADGRYRWRNIDFSIEYAESRSPIRDADVRYADALDEPITVFKRPTGLRLSDRSIVMGEIRTLSVGHPRVGYVNVVPQYWWRGPLYENRLGDLSHDGPQRDNIGFNLNGWYLLPERAITLTGNYKRYSSRAFEKLTFNEFYNELYVEFVNGFTGKTYLRFRDTERVFGNLRTLEEHDDWFTELQVENRLAWMRFQIKARELGQPFRQELFSLEARVNLTDKLKSYNRFTFANDPSVLRKGVFLQLQYRPTFNMEMFLEYGPGWVGDGNVPVDDFDLEGGGDQSNLVKFILKGWF